MGDRGGPECLARHSVTVRMDQNPRSSWRKVPRRARMCHAQQDKVVSGARRPPRLEAEGAVTAEKAWDQGPTPWTGLGRTWR